MLFLWLFSAHYLVLTSHCHRSLFVWKPRDDLDAEDNGTETTEVKQTKIQVYEADGGKTAKGKGKRKGKDDNDDDFNFDSIKTKGAGKSSGAGPSSSVKANGKRKGKGNSDDDDDDANEFDVPEMKSGSQSKGVGSAKPTTSRRTK